MSKETETLREIIEEIYDQANCSERVGGGEDATRDIPYLLVKASNAMSRIVSCIEKIEKKLEG